MTLTAQEQREFNRRLLDMWITKRANWSMRLANIEDRANDGGWLPAEADGLRELIADATERINHVAALIDARPPARASA